MIRRAVLLAAGRGTRLGPLAAQTPKCLLSIAGRVLLDRQLEAFAAVGIDDVTVVAGFMADAVVRHMAGRCRVVINKHYETTGSIASLALAARFLRGQAFVLQNADTLYSLDLLRRLLAAPHESVCLVDSGRPYQKGEYQVELAGGRVVQYSNQLPSDRAVGESAQLLRVSAAVSAAFLDRIDEVVSLCGPHGFPNQAYDVLIEGREGDDRGLWPVFTAGLSWWEIDSPLDLKRCSADHRLLERGIHGPPTGHVKPLRWGRFRWVAPTIGPLVRRPLRVARELKKFVTRELSLDGLDLAVNGEGFLRLIYAEAGAIGLEPFLLWGTLLGCIREGGFIRGDHDIDLGIMASDSGKMPALRERMIRRGFAVRIENDCKLSFVHPRHPRLYIDIDVVRPHRDGWAITNKHADPRRRFVYHFSKCAFDGTRATMFAGGKRQTVRIPQDAEGFLTAAYGDWRRPAPRVDYRYGPLNTEVELVSSIEPIGAAPEVRFGSDRMLAALSGHG